MMKECEYSVCTSDLMMMNQPRYQFFTYVKTKENELAEVPHEKVAGMLLYAQTEEEGKFNNEYQMMGNRICVRTLDLSGDFQSIKKQLDEIAEKYLLVKAA